MVVTAEESYRREEDTSINEDPYSHDEEAEETLSLCDLPIYSDELNCDDYSKQDRSGSFDDGDDTFFEFFSDDFSVSNSSYSGSDNIIFCGKLIPYKQPSDDSGIASEKISGRNRQFRLKSPAIDVRGGVKSFNSVSISLPKNPEYIKRKRSRKLMILESSPTKSRWSLFLFGSARFPKEMELSEMRIRQRRSSPPAMFRPVEGKKTGVHGLWKVLRALVMGCSSGSDQNVAVKGSFSPIPFPVV